MGVKCKCFPGNEFKSATKKFHYESVAICESERKELTEVRCQDVKCFESNASVQCFLQIGRDQRFFFTQLKLECRELRAFCGCVAGKHSLASASDHLRICYRYSIQIDGITKAKKKHAKKQGRMERVREKEMKKKK